MITLQSGMQVDLRDLIQRRIKGVPSSDVTILEDEAILINYRHNNRTLHALILRDGTIYFSDGNVFRNGRFYSLNDLGQLPSQCPQPSISPDGAVTVIVNVYIFNLKDGTFEKNYN